MHQGRVSVYSRGVGEGSAFMVELPILYSEEQKDDSVIAVAQSGESSVSLKILLVDDNLDVVASLSTLLEILGHEVFSVTDGVAGLQSALDRHPDVVILDIGLPGMDGYQVARMIRSQPELDRVRLIAVTGYGSEQDRDTAIAAGFDLHMVKPVEFSALVSALADATPGANNK
jgi:CheY-like chemotaxis protein